MPGNLKFRIVAVVAAFTLLLGIYTAKLWHPSETGASFGMYYTAALLVRGGVSAHIYDVIDRDANPQAVFADPASVFAQTAVAHGVTRVTLYIYPPTLADLVVPLTFMPFPAALMAWGALNVLMILAMGAILTRTLDMKFPGATVFVAGAILLFRPTLNNFHWGQVSILLAFLLTIGLGLYVQGHKSVAAFLIVLAIAIKLEPVVVVIPFLVWRDWKIIRSMALWGALLALGIWAVNGTQALNLYFLHQLPAMSNGELGGNLFDSNRSLGQIFFTYLSGAHSVLSSREIGWIVRAVSAAILCFAGWLSRLTPGEKSTGRRQFEIAMMFLLFACCLSPYSWFYNWALSAPVVVIFCMRVWDGRADVVETGLLVAFLLSLTTTKFDMTMVTPTFGIAMGLVALQRMREEWRPVETNLAIGELKAVSGS